MVQGTILIRVRKGEALCEIKLPLKRSYVSKHKMFCEELIKGRCCFTF